MFGYADTQRSFSNPGGTEQDYQCVRKSLVYSQLGEVSDNWTTGIELGNIRIVVKS